MTGRPCSGFITDKRTMLVKGTSEPRAPTALAGPWSHPSNWLRSDRWSGFRENYNSQEACGRKRPRGCAGAATGWRGPRRTWRPDARAATSGLCVRERPPIKVGCLAPGAAEGARASPPPRPLAPRAAAAGAPPFPSTPCGRAPGPPPLCRRSGPQVREPGGAVVGYLRRRCETRTWNRKGCLKGKGPASPPTLSAGLAPPS